MNGLSSNHVTAGILTQRLPTLLCPRERTLATLSMDFTPQRKVDAHGRTKRVEILVRHEANDDVRTSITPTPLSVFGKAGDEVELGVVEQHLSPLAFETTLGLSVWCFKMGLSVIRNGCKQMTAILTKVRLYGDP